MSSTDDWLQEFDLSNECRTKLKAAGYTMELLSASTIGDINEITNELQLSSSDGEKLKVAISKALELKTNGLPTIDRTESKALTEMQNKIDFMQRALDKITATEQLIDEQQTICRQRIETTFIEIAEALNRRKEQVLDRLQRMIGIKRRIVSSHRSDIEQQLEKAEDIKAQCHRLLSPSKTRNGMNGVKGRNGVNASISMKSMDRKKYILQKEKELNNLQLINDGIPTITVPLVFDADSERDHLLWTISKFGKIENKQNCDQNLKSKRKRKRRENKVAATKQDKWDENALGDNIKLSADKKSVICSELQSYCYRSCFGKMVEDKGCHHWTLRIRECQNGYCAWNMVIGVMKIEDGKEIPIYNYDQQSKLYLRNSHFTANERGYAFIGNLARLTKDRGHGTGREYGCPFVNKGDIIEVYLSLEERTLSYRINGMGFGVAFDCLDKKRYCLAVTFCGNGNQIELMRYDCLKYKS